MGILLIVYGLLLGVGGLVGYRKKKSGAALVVGGFSGILLIACGVLVMMSMRVPAYVGLIWTILLCLAFLRRYRTTKEFQPSGLMLIISLIVLVVMGYLLFLV